ncbi:DUF3795 domain-containing protein [Candidatus Borrarchaeum sp.]|uniref:DUF3795 domain-containing protein n=1 Tax=Candidatus Borrarchaeum sp. TaxID=2846742 RepID=UPI00257AD475|nr:DUF3795 domain-containing protein [Candidatus Borrarchaeum sp.]
MEQSKLYSNEDLVAYCGINCKECKAKAKRRGNLANLLKEALKELPLELFREVFPPFKPINEVMEFLEFLPMMSNMQTCCTSTEHPCGDPDCKIRVCIQEKNIRTCAECEEDYKTCVKLDFLKPGHKTLIEDLDFIKEKGFDAYVEDVIKKYKMDPVTVE